MCNTSLIALVGTKLIRRGLAALIMLLFVLVTGAKAAGIDPENCLYCHSLPWLAVIDDSTGVRNFRIDEEVYANSVHGRISCRQCHTDIEQVPHAFPVAQVNCSQSCHVIDPYTGENFSHRRTADLLASSIHGQKQADPRNALKPVCKDCHHNSVYWQETAENLRGAEQKCRECHSSFKGLDRAMKHLSLHMNEDQYWRHRMNFEACVRCHSNDELLADSLGESVQESIVAGFLKSFHGRGFTFGDRRSPVCADCHGTHGIFPQSDERSLIHPEKLRDTCGTMGCHDGATVAFATAGSMHNLYEGWRAKAFTLILWGYVFLIIGLLGVMALHNFLDTMAKQRAHKRHIAQHAPTAETDRRVYYRMNKSERISHVIMFVSFTLLALTGAMLWLPEHYFAFGSDNTIALIVRAWSHRVAAVCITAIGAYHIYCAIFTHRGRRLILEMVPLPKDIVLAWQNILWMLGKRTGRPRFAYFTYEEKLEYWGFAWGSVVMTVTGSILWMEHLGSKYVVDIARAVHSLEAILAVGTIVIWHFWNVNWKPGRWPMGDDWITGRIDREEMEDEHAGLLKELDDQNNPSFLPESELTQIEQGESRWITDGSKRMKFMRVSGYLILFLTTITCLLMAWSFRQYMRSLVPATPTGSSDPIQMVEDSLSVQNKGNASVPLLVAHLDEDWQYNRFHAASPVLELDPGIRQSECLLCHEILPHKQNRRLRADLNMHSRFMTCGVCHFESRSGGPVDVQWVDLRQNPLGSPGTPYGLLEDPRKDDSNQNSRITPSLGKPFLFQDQSSERSRHFLSLQEVPDPVMRAQIDLFHSEVVPPDELKLSCTDCHSKNGRIDFRKLGFSESRIRRLESESLAASIAEYNEFYLPPAY